MNTTHTPGPWIYAPVRGDNGEPARITVVAPTAVPGGNAGRLG